MACADCYKGYLRTDKSPVGTTETIYGLPTYVSLPPSGPIKGIIVIIPDAFGWQFLNNKLLADTYAAAGFRVYLPDFMLGTPAPTYFLTTMERFTTTSLSAPWAWLCKPYDLFWLLAGIVPFMWKNWPSTSHPRVVDFLEKLKTMPLDADKGLKVGVAGFCWGGKHVMLLAQAGEAHLIDAVFTAHPSMLALPADFDVRRPVSVAVGDKDQWLTVQQAKEAERQLKGLERDVPGLRSEVVIFPGAAHGFSVRIDLKNPRQVEQSQQAERQAISWFEQTLK